MEQQVNLFDMFGLEPVAETKKEEKKSKGVKKQSAEGKKAASQGKGKSSRVELPCTVYTGYFEPVVLSEEDFEDTKNITSDLILDKTCSRLGISKQLFSIEVEKSCAHVVPKPSCRLEKGSVHLNPESKMFLGTYVYDLSGIMTDTECDVDIVELKKFAASATPVLGDEKSISFFVADNMILPQSQLSILCALESFPVRVDIFGRQSLIISEEEYLKALAKDEKDDEKEDEENDAEEASNKTIDKDALIKVVEERFPDFKGYCDMRFHKGRSAAVVQMQNRVYSQAKEKTLIPVNGTTISLIFTKIELTPDMFDGKEEVETEDIVKYLHSIYPEYSKERTDIIYDAKKHLVIPILKGSRKGAGIECVTDEVREKELLAQPVCVYQKEVDGVSYRVENLPFMYAAVSGGCEGTHSFKLPKIPAEVFAQAKEFFRSVCFNYDSEAMLQLFWDPRNKEYFLYCPEQTVSYAHVSIVRNWELEMTAWLIMDIHSHGKITCSFSRIDDADEQGTRYYGVFYGYGAQEPRFDLRVGCGGRFLPVSKSDLFEDADSGVTFEYFDWMSKIMRV